MATKITETTIARTKVFDLLRGQLKGVLFHAVFVKADGSTRHMIARTGVHKAKGTGSYSHTRDIRRNNITVYEMAGADSGYKAIPLDRLISLKVYGRTYTIN